MKRRTPVVVVVGVRRNEAGELRRGPTTINIITKTPIHSIDTSRDGAGGVVEVKGEKLWTREEEKKKYWMVFVPSSPSLPVSWGWGEDPSFTDTDQTA